MSSRHKSVRAMSATGNRLRKRCGTPASEARTQGAEPSDDNLVERVRIAATPEPNRFRKMK